MPDNTEPTENDGGAPQPKNTDWLPPEARELVSKANNEAATFRTQLRAKTEEHTAALDQISSLSGEKDAATERAIAAEKELLKFRIAVESGVPGAQAAQFAARLQGDDEDALKGDAANLLGLFTQSSQVQQNATDPTQGHGEGEGAGLSAGAAFLSKALRGI